MAEPDSKDDTSIKHQPQQNPITREKFNLLKEMVLEKKPILREILEKRGKKTLAEYAKDYTDVNPDTYSSERQDELITAIVKELNITITPEIAQSVANQLKKYYFVSTADHFGPICHPFFVNANLMACANYKNSGDKDLQNIVVLSCSNISFDNSSFPRGLQFHSSQSGETKLYQLPLFSRIVRPYPVFNAKPFCLESINEILKNIAQWHKNNEINETVKEKLEWLLNKIYLQSDVLACDVFADQISKTNLKIWQTFFGRHTAEMPNLIYIEQERLVTNLLIENHLNKPTIIHDILFNSEYHDYLEKYFDGIMGGFTLAEKKGTYLFWAFPPGSKYRQQLWKKDNFLITEDESYKIELIPSEIARALAAKEIFSSTLLSFITLSFYYGLKLLGGFNQVNYLTEMKQAYKKFLEEIGSTKEILFTENIQTKELIDAPTVAFGRGRRNELIPATGLDLFLYNNDETLNLLRKTLNSLTLEDALMPLLPELYKVIYPEPQRDKQLMEITSEDITCLLHLDDKEEACISI